MSTPGQGAGQDDIIREVLKQQRLIRAVLHRSGVPGDHLDDLVQDVLVIAHRRIQEGAFRPPDDRPLSGAVAAWLTGISRHLAKDFRLSLAIRDWIFVGEQCPRADVEVLNVPSPEAQVIAKEELAILSEVKLSAVQREIVRRTALGHTAVEIGAALGLVPDTVSTHLRRARMAFSRALQKRGR